MNNLLVAQSGGPTAAINATLAGIIQGAATSSSVDKVYGAVNGIVGVLEERFVELNDILKDSATAELLIQTPAAALGSCRFKLSSPEKDESHFETILNVLKKYEIRYFIYIGGNDSMDTVDKLSMYLKNKGINDIFIMGAPKTIDNDLAETDHCPGFGSAAKYIATTFAELERDISVYSAPAVTIVEVMGRDAGWLTAASGLARLNGFTGPRFIYLCEEIFSIDGFISTIEKELKVNPKKGILVAVSEGIRDSKGVYIGTQGQKEKVDVFGHSYLAGAGKVLESIVHDNIGCKTRAVELNLMQRAASHIASLTDLNESRMLGLKALQRATEGATGEMAAILRKSSDPYDVYYSSVRVSDVANKVKTVPSSYINKDGNDITDAAIQYIKPLIQGEVNIVFQNGIPKHIKLY